MPPGLSAVSTLAIDADPGALVTAADSHIRAGRPSSAIPLLTRAAALRPADATILGMRSAAHSAAGHAAAAVADARAATRLAPRAPAHYVRLASALLAAGDAAGAAAAARLGMRCGDTSRNGELGGLAAAARARAALAPAPWTPVGRREAVVWRLRDVRAVVYAAWRRAVGALARGPLRLVVAMFWGR